MGLRIAGRFFAIGFIIVATSIGWLLLGGVIDSRTRDSAGRGSRAVQSLWGGPLAQPSPVATQVWTVVEPPAPEALEKARAEGKPEPPSREKTLSDGLNLVSSRVRADLKLEHRRKGLLWFSTYRVRFAGRYEVRNDDRPDGTCAFLVPHPGARPFFDDYRVTLDGVDQARFFPSSDPAVPGLEVRFPLPAGVTRVVEVSYLTQGLDEWRYLPPREPRQTLDLDVEATTDFTDIDFADDTMSPTTKEATGAGWTLRWTSSRLMAARDIAVVMPAKLNPGPLAAAMSRFAPVSLTFFLGVLFFLALLRGLPLHPMHFAFLAASFFSFHLLFAYLVDHLDLTLSFVLASAVSVLLVVSYLRVVVSPRFAVLEAGSLQLLYLVVFARAHFTPGWTGLIVTIGAIATLFVVMQATARVDWEQALRGSPSPPARVPPPLPSR